MQLNERIQVTYQALLEQAKRTPILLLHPKSKFRSVQVAMLVNDSDASCFYYALGLDDVEKDKLLIGLYLL